MGILLLSSSQKLTNYFFLLRTKQIIRKFGNLLFPANKSTPAAVHGYLVSKGCLRGVQKAAIQGVQSKYVLMFTIGHVNFFLKKECCQKKWPLHYFGWGWGWGVDGGFYTRYAPPNSNFSIRVRTPYLRISQTQT